MNKPNIMSRKDLWNIMKCILNYIELCISRFKRWEENMCECLCLSLYEVGIAYKIEDFLINLRVEWEESIKYGKLEDRNWNLLRELEGLMQLQ